MSLWSRVKGVFGSAPYPSPEALFSSLFAGEAKAHPVVSRVEESPSEPFTLLVWKTGKELPVHLYLGNIFAETRELSPDDRVRRIRAMLGMLDVDDEKLSWDDARSSLVPLVRLASFGIDAPLGTLVHQPFLPFVHLFAGLDRGSSIRYVNGEQLETWGVEARVVFDEAFATLGGHHTDADVEPYDPEASYPIWHITRDDSYEASRLALPGFLASLRGRVNGNPIAIVPERAKLIVSGDGDSAAILRLARTAEAEFRSSPRPISPAVYTLSAAGSLEHFRLPEAHEHHHLVERGYRILAATVYADQKEVLDKRHEADGTDIYVATLSVLTENDTGKTQTYAALGEDIDTLLPEADLIAMAQGDDWSGMVPWSTLLEHAPECFEKDPSLDPPRWRVVGWPDDDAWEKLRAAAVRKLKG